MLVDAAGSQSEGKRIEEKSGQPDPSPSAGANAGSTPPNIVPQQNNQHQPSDASVMSDASLIQQQATLAAAVQQQVAALVLATDIRAAVAAAQLQQAAQIQNQDILMARAAALSQQQLGLAGISQQNFGLAGIAGLSKDQLEELQKQQKQMLSMAAPIMAGPPPQLTSSALAASQQLQDAQMPPGQTNLDAILDRAGLHQASIHSSASVAGSTSTGTGGIQRPPGSTLVPCRARGMPMDHNFKVNNIVLFSTAHSILSYTFLFGKRLRIS